MTKTIDSTTDLRTFSGADLLHYVNIGKRSKHFDAVLDEIDRRVIRRLMKGKALTEPIVEALAILDRRGIIHAGPLAVDAKVLTESEKVTEADFEAPFIGGVPDEYRYSDGSAALVSRPKDTGETITVGTNPAADRKALVHEANEVAKVLAERLCTTNDKGYVKNLIHAKRLVKLDMGLIDA